MGFRGGEWLRCSFFFSTLDGNRESCGKCGIIKKINEEVYYGIKTDACCYNAQCKTPSIDQLLLMLQTN